MISYIFTTLAIGQEYLNKAKQFSNDLFSYDKNFQRIIISDISDNNIINTSVITLEESSVTQVCNYFNYNLKYQAIKYAINFNTDYIIYIDADWRINKNYSSEKINKFLSSNPDIDFYFERPHSIGASKKDEYSCFWKHKIEPYKLMLTDKYDHAHVCNEQFLIFKNNDKIHKFIEAWEQRNNFCVNNNIWTFAEGVEIGMSAIDANMNSTYSNFYEIKECFEFNDISNNLYIRF
jgi:hypothetical protein